MAEEKAVGGQAASEKEEQPVSRIVVEFAGPGGADVIGSKFENISVGQMLAFAKWAEWQAERAVMKMELERQKAMKLRQPKIVVPRGPVQ